MFQLKNPTKLFGFENFERMFVKALSIVAALISFFGGIINFLLGFEIELIILPLISSIIFIGIYFWAKGSKKFFYVKLFLTTISFVFVNFLFLYNYGSHGPSVYFYIIIYSLLVFIWSNIQLIIVSIILFLNLFIVFYLDYNYPYLIGNYQSDSARIIDVYTGIIMYGAIIFALVNKAKNSLIDEYHKAKKSDMLKSAFLANLSHEIRTPMNAIIGFSQLLKDHKGYTEDEINFFIDTINNQGDHLLHLINDIIDVSKIESGVIQLYDTVIDIDDFLEEIHNSFEKNNKKSVELITTFSVENNNSKILVDSVRLKQVLTNLISNAIKFTEKGYVQISYKLDHDDLLFQISDTGIGIKQEEITRIFDRFYQAETTNRMKLNEGTGIGLSISKALVELMGGKIWVESAENKGSSFYFTIPYKPVDLPVENNTASHNSNGTTLKDKVIMVVEDNDSNYRYINQLLTNMGSQVIWRKNGAEAIEYLQLNNNIDLILMDLLMPVMNGFEATKIIKKMYPDLPIIAQTALTMENDVTNAKMAGCDDYISKPIRNNQLLEKIKNNLS